MSTKPTLRRLLRIDAEIRSGRHPSSRALARRLEVSPRTLLRDLEYLKKTLGAPLQYVAERKGYRYGDPAYRFSPVAGDRGAGDEIEIRLEPGLAVPLLEQELGELTHLLCASDGRTEIRQVQLRTDGGAELVVATTDLDPALRRVLALGPLAEITGPPAARRRVRAILKQLAARYA